LKGSNRGQEAGNVIRQMFADEGRSGAHCPRCQYPRNNP
jgi:hypothetical protein